MSEMQIPDAAVGAAAQVFFDLAHPEANVSGLTLDGSPGSVGRYHRYTRAALEAALPYLAPAGDGGLRAAMEKLAGDMAYDSSDGGAKIRAVLDARPAVPQPVDREALAAACHNAMPFHVHDWKDGRRCGEGHRRLYYAQADAVLALLAGEQEQVERRQ